MRLLSYLQLPTHPLNKQDLGIGVILVKKKFSLKMVSFTKKKLTMDERLGSFREIKINRLLKRTNLFKNERLKIEDN